MKDLVKTKKFINLQIQHFPNKALVQHSTYIKKILKCFNMDKAHPLSSPMVVQPFDVKKRPISSLRKGENLHGLEVSYLSTISTLMYLANCTVQILFF